MIAEVLLVLSGHPSAFFVSQPSAPHSPTTLSLSPSLSEYLHPGEIASLNSLGQLAFRYQRIRSWALSIQDRSRSAVLLETTSKKGKERAGPPDEASTGGSSFSTLVAGLLGVLGEYEVLVVEIEGRVLALNPGLVQDGKNHVPLSALVATFDAWQPVFASLSHLVDTLSVPPRDGHPVWTPGQLIHHLTILCDTGNPRLRSIYLTLLHGLRTSFLTHLAAFLLYGQAPAVSTSASPSIGIDAGPDPLSPQHRVYKLNTDLFAPGIGSRTRESILYVGRVSATLKREGKTLPAGVIAGLREEIMGVQDLEDGGGLDAAVSRARAEVGEWLWKNVLTGPQVVEAIETFGNYFLLRKADFAVSLIRELHHLTHTKLLTANPRSSTSVIRDTDLNTALLRASLGTSAETDPNLEKLSFRLEDGPLRPIMPSLRARKRQPLTGEAVAESATRDMFSSAILGAPVELRYRIGWPLDLFMTPSSISTYSDIHAYLFALRDTHSRVTDAWARLSLDHRLRQKRGGLQLGDELDHASRRLSRAAWSTARGMLFFLEQLLGHFTTDIINVQHRRLIEELDIVGLNEERRTEGHLERSRSDSGASPAPSVRGGPSSVRQKASISRFDSVKSLPGSIRGGAISPTSDTFDAQSVRSKGPPPTPRRTQATFLDFLSLRQMHTRHLSFLRDGLLLSDPNLASLMRDIMDTCKRFAGLVDRWGGDGVPEALSSGAEEVVQERLKQMSELGQTFNDQLADIFRALLETQNPIAAKDDASSNGTAGTSFSRTARTVQMSRLMSRHQSGFSVASARRANAGSGKGKSKADIEKEDKGMEAEAAMSRHIEQLLLRLDFNGVLTGWMAKEEEGTKSRNLLGEGGL